MIVHWRVEKSMGIKGRRISCLFSTENFLGEIDIFRDSEMIVVSISSGLGRDNEALIFSNHAAKKGLTTEQVKEAALKYMGSLGSEIFNLSFENLRNEEIEEAKGYVRRAEKATMAAQHSLFKAEARLLRCSDPKSPLL